MAGRYLLATACIDQNPRGRTITPNDQYDLLVSSVLLVAASAVGQVSALPELVVVIDEVATTFGDAAAALRELDEHVERAPDDDRLSDPERLRDHLFWGEARWLATDALAKLGEERRPPNLPITWVRG